jgi:hypothetical protein
MSKNFSTQKLSGGVGKRLGHHDDDDDIRDDVSSLYSGGAMFVVVRPSGSDALLLLLWTYRQRVKSSSSIFQKYTFSRLSFEEREGGFLSHTLQLITHNMTFLNSANRRKTIAGGRQKKEIQSSPFAG